MKILMTIGKQKKVLYYELPFIENTLKNLCLAGNVRINTEFKYEKYDGIESGICIDIDTIKVISDTFNLRTVEGQCSNILERNYLLKIIDEKGNDISEKIFEGI